MNKIEALKKTIAHLKSGATEYTWMSNDHCNCGVVAKTLLNDELPTECGFYSSPLRGENGAFSKQAYCMTTNLPLPKVFQALKDAGFTHNELFKLEYLADDDIVEEMNLSNVHIVKRCTCSFLASKNGLAYKEKEYLILYLEAWVRLLEKEQKPLIKEVIRYVAVSQTIREMELVEN